MEAGVGVARVAEAAQQDVDAEAVDAEAVDAEAVDEEAVGTVPIDAEVADAEAVSVQPRAAGEAPCGLKRKREDEAPQQPAPSRRHRYRVAFGVGPAGQYRLKLVSRGESM